jgi:endonuclease-3
MKPSSPLRPGSVKRLHHIDRALATAYGTPETDLGNKSDPLDEAIYIILSFQTDLARFGLTWSRLRTTYQSWETVERASPREVARILREGGLYRQKTRTIQSLLAEVRAAAGELSLDLLRGMDQDHAERFLTRLPGLSWKGARCVLLYSLGHDVLPIDSNSFRILKRTGVIASEAVYRRRATHDAIQDAVPAHRRRSLHVNLVVHGQRTCLPRGPKCERCPLTADCPKVGLPSVTRHRARWLSARTGRPRANAAGTAAVP